MKGQFLLPLSRLATAHTYRQYRKHLDDPEAASQACLTKIIASASATEYGKQFGLSSNASYTEYQEKIPLVTYSDLKPWLLRQQRSRDQILVSKPIRCFEPTSGSSDACKLIPYTDSLLKAFSQMFSVWAHDILRFGPILRSGLLFAAVSPCYRVEKPPDLVAPVGMEQEQSYTVGVVRRLLSRLAPSFTSLKDIKDNISFLDVAALLLISRPWEVISVWHPLYLTTLLTHLRDHHERLAVVWQTGEWRNGHLVIRFPRPTNRRLQIFKSGDFDAAAVFEDLRLVSCWGHGTAKRHVATLQNLLPHAVFQPKGLLSTEGPITVPLVAADGHSTPVFDGIFLEFIDDQGVIFPIDALKAGQTYAVVLSQASGLLRYQLGDQVRCTGFFGKSPLLTFVGRLRHCDLVGEKLTEVAVQEAVTKILPNHRFAILIPESIENDRYRYTLFTDATTADGLARALDDALCANYHYAVARRQHQLAPAAIRMDVSEERILRHLARQSTMDSGAIKPHYLWHKPLPTNSLDAV